MKKLMRDITFVEFDEWCNRRAGDGKWSRDDALLCCNMIKVILDIKPIFGRKKAREQAWERIKVKYFNLDAELDV